MTNLNLINFQINLILFNYTYVNYNYNYGKTFCSKIYLEKIFQN